MNILFTFKAEPDLGMLSTLEWQAAARQGGPDTSALPVSPGADEQTAAAILLAQVKTNNALKLTALTLGDQRALHWLRYFAALGFEKRILIEADNIHRFAPETVARQIARQQGINHAELIVTGSLSSEGQNGQTPYLVAEMLGWPCLSQVTDFSVEPPFVVVQQKTRRCRVRLPAIIAVCQTGAPAMPVPGMRQRLAAAKSDIIREPLAFEESPRTAVVSTQTPPPRGAVTMIDGATAQEKAQTLWRKYLQPRMVK